MPNFVKSFRYIQKNTSDLKSIIKGISCLIDINWFVHESPGLKPDWFGEIKSFSMKYSDRRSKTFSANEKQRYWLVISHFPFIGKLSVFEGRLEDQFKRFTNRFATYFQHANAYHILATSFARIKTTNSCCNLKVILENDFSVF